MPTVGMTLSLAGSESHVCKEVQSLRLRVTHSECGQESLVRVVPAVGQEKGCSRDWRVWTQPGVAYSAPSRGGTVLRGWIMGQGRLLFP